MKKRILITYASFGSGHKTIAEYVESYFKDKNQDYEIMNVDIVEYSSLLGKIGLKLFNLNLKYRSKLLFTIVYYLFDNKLTTFSYKKTTLKLYKNRDLIRKIIEFNPDLTISTHFFASILMGCYNEKGLTNSKIITIITDYTAYELFIKNHKADDAIIVGNEIIKNILINKGVEAKKIKVFGLPISDKFELTIKDKTKIFKQYNLNPDKPIILMFGGGSMGSLSYLSYFKKLVKQDLYAHIIFVSGNNKNLKNKCESFIYNKKIKNVTILGFTKDVMNLMNISSFIISKPGAATITECIEMKRPMILIPGYGGQEISNARYLMKKGFALRTYSAYGLARKVKRILKHPYIILKIKKRLEKTEKNESVKKIYKLAEKMLKEKD